MRTSDITPKGLEASEKAMRKAVAQYIVGERLQRFLVDAKRKLQEKQERVNALRKMLAAMDAAKFVSSGEIAFDYGFKRAQFVCGLGTISEDGYRATFAQDLAELESIKNAVEILEELSNKSEVNHGV